MNSADDLREQLLHAADSRNGIVDQEKRRLLEQAIYTIRDLRDHIHRWPGRHVVDAVDGLAATARFLTENQSSHDQAETALKDAADMIRDLSDVHENGIEPTAYK